MAAPAAALPAFASLLPSSSSPPRGRILFHCPFPPRRSSLRPVKLLPAISAVEKAKGTAAEAEEVELEGMPPEFYDEDWQAHQRERTKEWHAYRKKEEAEEERITNEYREIGMRLKAYPQEDVCKARILVSSFIRAGEDIEEEIEKAAERGELTELVLMVIWNRLDVARRDIIIVESAENAFKRQDERDAIRSLDLLYRRVEMEILRSEATPAMRLLNDLLNLHDGSDDDKWLKKCKKHMLEVFPREDPFTMVFPAGFNMEKHQGQIKLPPQDDDVLLRVDFIREVDELLKEVKVEQENNKIPTSNDPEAVATKLKYQEKMQTVRQVESLLELAGSLKW
uniref:Protein PALE CRESS, chloroplastic n=1 Tax=Leersia perrieri TaxID=77586 RepID=A0A0D9WG65_9ORYZ